MAWANENWPAGEPHPVDSIFERWGDWEYERKCVGAIFRRCCRIDPGWLVKIAKHWPVHVVALSPWIKSVEMPWGPVPGRLAWRDWVEAAQIAVSKSPKPAEVAS